MDQLHNQSLLVQEMQAGNEIAFTALYSFYSPSLYMNILRMVRDPLTAEELVQELFTRIWQKRRSAGIRQNFAGYMYRIAKNLVHDHFRRIKRDHLMLEKFRLLAEENYEDIEDGLFHEQSTAILNRAIEQLSPQQKIVYKLVRMNGCTYKRAAEMMGVSPHTVKEYLVSTKKSIKNYVLKNADAGSLLLLLVLANYTARLNP